MRERVRLDSLTSARFIAAILVFGFHSTAFLEPTPHWVRDLVGQGRLGVSFFFILSGFIITWNYRTLPAASFLRSRLTRLYPAYIVALAIALLSRLIADPSGLQAGWTTPFFIQSWFPSSHYYFAVNVPAWSLSCEFFFYAITPFLIPRLMAMKPRSQIFLAGSLVAVPLILATMVSVSGSINWENANLGANSVPIWLAFYFPPSRLPEYVLGVMGALYVRNGGREISLRWAIPIAVPAYFLSAHVGAFGVVAVTMGPLWLLIVALAQRDASEAPAWIMHRKTLVTLGEWSYSFYLIHHIFILRLSQHGFAQFGVSGWRGILVTFLLSLVSAWCLHRFVEVPAARALRHPAPRAAAEALA